MQNLNILQAGHQREDVALKMAESRPAFQSHVCDGKVDGFSSTHRRSLKVQGVYFMSKCDTLLIITTPNRYFWWLNLTEQSGDIESQGSQHNETFGFQGKRQSKKQNKIK